MKSSVILTSIVFMLIGFFGVIILTGCSPNNPANQPVTIEIPDNNSNGSVNSTVENTTAESTTIGNSENGSEGYTLVTKQGTCFDSDRGITIDKTGYVIDAKGVRHDDTCNGRTVIEYYCSEWEKDMVGTRSELCDACQNGRCIPIVKESKCNETDKGIDYQHQGTVTDILGKTYTDYCSTKATLFEYYCDSYDYGKKVSYVCDNGCQDGACL